MIVNLRARNSRGELLALAVGAGVLLAAVLLILAPRVRAASRYAYAAADLSAQTRRLEAELAPYRRLLVAGAQPGPTRIFGGGTAEAAIPALLDRLSALGRDCALKVTAMTPQAGAPRTLPVAAGAPDAGAGAEPHVVRVLTVAVEAEADFAGLGRYLEALSRLDVPLTVLALRVEPAAHGGADRVSARFTLGTWVLEGAAPAAEVAHAGA
jgi:hypothetical protein